MCLIEIADGLPVIRLDPGSIRNPLPGIDYTALMIAPGDGRVTQASAQLPDTVAGRAATVCARHDNLASHPQTLLLLSQFLSPPRAEVPAPVRGAATTRLAKERKR